MTRKAFTLVCGASETGKTSFAIRYLLNSRYSTRLIFDPDGEFAQRLGLPSVGRAVDLDLAWRRGWVCFDPGVHFAGRNEDAFRWFLAWSMDVARSIPNGTSLLVVDECWKFCSPHSIPPEFAAVLQTGRKVGLQGMFLTQRPAKLNGALHNETTETVSFLIQEAAGLEKLEAEHGLDAAEIKALPPGKFVAVNRLSRAVLRGALF